MAEEVITELKAGGLQILQKTDGYRFSIDPVLLCAFADIPADARVADLGSGSGVVAMLLARRGKGSSILGLELQPEMVERALRSVRLNSLQSKVEIVLGDVRELPPELVPGSFDAVTCNPPYRKVSSGRIAPNFERAQARHELAGGIDGFVKAAAALLKSNGGFFVVFLTERLVELFGEMRKHRLEPKRLQMIQSRSGERSGLVLVEGRKDGKEGLVVEAPLVVYVGSGREYHPDVLAMYDN